MIKFLKYILILTTILFGAELAKANDYERAFEALAAEDYKTAVYYLSFFASNGDARSQYNIGIIYRDGLGVEKNSSAALAWFLLAAEQKHALANYAVGLLLRDGPVDVQQPERRRVVEKVRRDGRGVAVLQHTVDRWVDEYDPQDAPPCSLQ